MYKRPNSPEAQSPRGGWLGNPFLWVHGIQFHEVHISKLGTDRPWFSGRAGSTQVAGQ